MEQQFQQMNPEQTPAAFQPQPDAFVPQQTVLPEPQESPQSGFQELSASQKVLFGAAGTALALKIASLLLAGGLLLFFLVDFLFRLFGGHGLFG